MDLHRLFEEYGFLPAEREFIETSNTAITAEMNQSRIVSEFILRLRIERATKRIID